MHNSLLRLKILIVDDIREHAERLQRKIAHLEHEIIIATSPTKAIKLISSTKNLYNPIDVAIIDYFMPEMDGIELSRKLQAIDPYLNVMILTSDCSTETAKTILAAGLDSVGLITKNEDISVILSSLRYTLANKELQLSGDKSFLRERTSRYNTGRKKKD